MTSRQTRTVSVNELQRHSVAAIVKASSSTALNVWWFGGTESSETVDSDADSCELVAVRIERTSANSRRIAGDITVPARSKDVWSILTDYNRLSTHVPNLMESKILNVKTKNGKQGDGSFRCRLYQKGAQKIVGFDFSASVTMDMTESVLPTSRSRQLPPAAREEDKATLDDDRMIGFKCADSFFFKEFDGEWKVQEQLNPSTGEIESNVSYLVDVRPKGPVPVAALEWRIREDVPTNLRAVKKAALGLVSSRLVLREPETVETENSALINGSDVGQSATKSSRRPTIRRINASRVNNAMQRSVNAANVARQRTVAAARRTVSSRKAQPVPVPVPVASVYDDWDRDETMAAYLPK